MLYIMGAIKPVMNPLPVVEESIVNKLDGYNRVGYVMRLDRGVLIYACYCFSLAIRSFGTAPRTVVMLTHPLWTSEQLNSIYQEVERITGITVDTLNLPYKSDRLNREVMGRWVRVRSPRRRSETNSADMALALMLARLTTEAYAEGAGFVTDTTEVISSIRNLQTLLQAAYHPTYALRHDYLPTRSAHTLYNMYWMAGRVKNFSQDMCSLYGRAVYDIIRDPQRGKPRATWDKTQSLDSGIDVVSVVDWLNEHQ